MILLMQRYELKNVDCCLEERPSLFGATYRYRRRLPPRTHALLIFTQTPSPYDPQARNDPFSNHLKKVLSESTITWNYERSNGYEQVLDALPRCETKSKLCIADWAISEWRRGGQVSAYHSNRAMSLDFVPNLSRETRSMAFDIDKRNF